MVGSDNYQYPVFLNLALVFSFDVDFIVDYVELPEWKVVLQINKRDSKVVDASQQIETRNNILDLDISHPSRDNDSCFDGYQFQAYRFSTRTN